MTNEQKEIIFKECLYWRNSYSDAAKYGCDELAIEYKGIIRGICLTMERLHIYAEFVDWVAKENSNKKGE